VQQVCNSPLTLHLFSTLVRLLQLNDDILKMTLRGRRDIIQPLVSQIPPKTRQHCLPKRRVVDNLSARIKVHVVTEDSVRGVAMLGAYVGRHTQDLILMLARAQAEQLSHLRIEIAKGVIAGAPRQHFMAAFRIPAGDCARDTVSGAIEGEDDCRLVSLGKSSSIERSITV